MRKQFCFVVILTLFLSFTGCINTPVDSNSSTVTEESSLSYHQISQDEAKQMMSLEGTQVIVDVRRQDEYDAGHIPGAILIPNESINDTPPKELPDKSQIILIYCRSGNRSKQAAEKLSAMGYTNIYEFGGINTWDGEIVTTNSLTDSNAIQTSEAIRSESKMEAKEYEMDRWMDFDSLDLYYEAHMAGLDGENLWYNVYFDYAPTDEKLSEVDQALLDFYNTYEDEETYLGWEWTTLEDGFIQVYLDLGNVDPEDNDLAINGVLNALNQVTGIQCVIINEDCEYY